MIQTHVAFSLRFGIVKSAHLLSMIRPYKIFPDRLGECHQPSIMVSGLDRTTLDI